MLRVAALLACASGTAANAQVIDVSFTRPSADRWMYPFNFSRGAEQRAPTFGAILQAGFDDRDAQFLLGFTTGGANPLVTPGLGVANYCVMSARLTVVVASDLEAVYDPTADSFTSLLPEGDPRRTIDTDLGRPVELFGAGYRNGWTLESFQESSAFGGVPEVDPAEGARNVFASVIDEAGVATDVSRQVRQGFDAVPLAIATTDEVAPGDHVPAGTVMTFDLSPCDPSVQRYLADALNRGKINLIVSSLAPADGGPGGGTGERVYPTFYTKENPVNLPATLTLTVRVGDPADFNGDGFVDFFDYDAFVGAFESGGEGADFNMDCFIDFFDYDAFVEAFQG
ncbi:MAG: hypothetical protein HEQ23_05020 [Tepidisphaera sp.]